MTFQTFTRRALVCAVLATTFTSSPLAFLKAGNKCANKPDCSVDVVDDITIDWACAHTEVLAKTAHTSARRVKV